MTTAEHQSQCWSVHEQTASLLATDKPQWQHTLKQSITQDSRKRQYIHCVPKNVHLLQSPAYGSSDSGSKTVTLFWPCFIFFPTRFFDVPGPILAKLCHTTRCVLKYFISYMGVHTFPLKNPRGKKTIFCRFADPKSTRWALPFPNAGKMRKSKTIRSICGYVRTSIPNIVGFPPPPEIGCHLGVWGGADKLWIDITSPMTASDSLFDYRGRFSGSSNPMMT